jgi:outer membrane protein
VNKPFRLSPAFASFFIYGALQAQPLLTPDEAVHLALEKNFSLSLARDQTAEAVVNRQSAIGPFLPGASASVNTSGNLKDSVTRQTTVGAALNWQIFEGFQSYHAYRRLKSSEKAAEWQERLAVETTVEAVLNAYYGVVLQKQLLAAIQEKTGVTEDQAKLAQAKAGVGSGSHLDALQAIATLNEDSSSLLSQQVALHEAKIQLNQLLARAPETDFEVSDSIPVETGLPVEKWRATLADDNSTVLQAQARRNAATSGLGEARGLWWPSLNAGVAYSSTPSSLNSGSTRPDGATYSVNLTVPLFDQLRGHQAVSNAKLELRQSETRFQQALEDVRAEFEQEHRKYAAGRQRVDLETRNLDVAIQQADAAQERYKAGSGTALEFRDAQRILLDARSRLATARQNTQQAELALKRLAGALVKE